MLWQSPLALPQFASPLPARSLLEPWGGLTQRQSRFRPGCAAAAQPLGKSRWGLTKGGLPEKIGGEFFLFEEDRALSGLIGAFSGPIGAFWDQFLCALHAQRRAEIAPAKVCFWSVWRLWAEPARAPVCQAPV